MNTTIKAWFLDSPLPRANCKRLEAKRVKRLPGWRCAESDGRQVGCLSLYGEADIWGCGSSPGRVAPGG